MIRAILALAVLLPFFAKAQTITPGAQPTGGLGLFASKFSGRFYGPQLTGSPAGAAVGSSNRLYASPVFIASTSQLKSLSFDISTGNASAWNARMCVYDSGLDGLPNNLVSGSDTGAIAIASGSVTGVQTGALSGSGATLYGPSWYWVSWVADSSSESVFSITSGNAPVMLQSIIGGASASDVYGGANPSSVFRALTFGACPATFGSATFVSSAPAPYVVLGF